MSGGPSDRTGPALSASGLSGRAIAQERLPVPFTPRTRAVAWATLVVLVIESYLYSLPTTRTQFGPRFVADWAFDCLNVWGWGPWALITLTALAVTLAVLTLITAGFQQGPAWIHVSIIPAPIVATAAAFPLILFVVLWVIVILVYVALTIGVIACLFAFLTEWFES